MNWSIGRFLEWLGSKPTIVNTLHGPLNWKWLSPEQHSQQTPVGALAVHWAFTIVLILATWGQADIDAYSLIVTLYVFVIDAVFGLLLALGIIYLRLKPSEQWKEKSKPFVPFLSISAAVLFVLGNLFPLVTFWIPPNKGKYAQSIQNHARWFTVPTIGTSVIGFSVIWWIGFCVVTKKKEKRQHALYEVKKVPAFEKEPPQGEGGYPVMRHERVHISLLGQENIPMT
jgi:amino acid transporter